MKTKLAPRKRPTCSLCGEYHGQIHTCEGGYVCEACLVKGREGRDATSKAVKTAQRALRGHAQNLRTQYSGGVVDDMLEYDVAASGALAVEAFGHQTAVVLVDGGESLPQSNVQFIDTLVAPGTVALDASNHRLDLITAMGTDVAAMALDTSDTVQASNSIEKMLAHQSAVLHDNAMRYVTKANLAEDPIHSVRLMNVAVRLMDTFQRGVLTMKRLRGTGEQRITIQHVNVNQGGQAVIGQVNPGGGGTE